MTKKFQSPFQPDHTGKQMTVPVNPAMVISHNAHADGRLHENEVQKRDGEQRYFTDRMRRLDPRVGGKPKNQQVVPVHPASISHRGVGGNHISYLDSMSGATVTGAPKTAPGWGSGTERSGHPFAAAPASKVVRPVETSFGQRSRVNEDQKKQMLGKLGHEILREALSGADFATRNAYQQHPAFAPLMTELPQMNKYGNEK